MRISIIYEDNDLLAIEKPAGMVVNRAESVRGETIQDWAERRLKAQGSRLKAKIQNSKFKEFYERSGIVHRIDKETSGLLLIAKNPQSFEDLQKQFKERTVEKRYLALVHGKVAPAEGEIKAPVGRLPWNRERFGVFPGGREAVTKYKVLQYLYLRKQQKWEVRSGKCDYTLLEVRPATGRTHQIRVHLKYLGHPLVGDSFYAGRKTVQKDKKWCPRLFLHASFLKFKQPTREKWIEVKSELPENLNNVVMQFIAS